MALNEVAWAFQLMREPEYASVEAFVEYCIDDERVEFTSADLGALNRHTRRPVHELRLELETYGLRLALRR